MKAIAVLAYALSGIHAGGQQVMPIGYAPAWSPDGARLAFVTLGDLWVADADGTHRAFLVPRGNDPAWAPDGRRIAFSRDGFVWTVRADGLDERRLARGDHPAWSPLGRRIAFDRDGQIVSARWSGGELHVIADGEEPAWAHDGKLAFVRDGKILVRGRVVASGRQPTWGPESHRLAYVREGTIYVGETPVATGAQPDWQPALRTPELLPDFDQRPPADLMVSRSRGLWLLGFTSYVDNVGLGPAMIVGRRPTDAPRMLATQRVALSNGAWRSYPGTGQLRYTRSPSHRHWHLMRFDSYELRTLDGSLLVRDRKSGFCLADHYGIAPGDFERKPRFLGNCGRSQPEATTIVQGTSVGFTDRYPAFFHGQNVDITDVPAGTYVLVHRANENLLLHELRYENDAASVRIGLSWNAGIPRVKILRRCAASAIC